MNYTRRRALQGATVLAGAAAWGAVYPIAVRAQPGPAPRQRLEDFIADPKKLAALKRGVFEMKRRKPSDPKSWFYQGAIHSVSPEAVQAALALDSDVATVDQAKFWNRCPHSASQNSADFLLWHRAYVYYFEQILREASEDATFSLPYWNYTERTQRGFPSVFADAAIDAITQKPTNPLFDHRREQAFAFGLYELSEGAAGTVTIFGETEFFGATEDKGLAGGVADNNARTRGRIEQQPHDVLHFAIGGAIGTGDVDTGEGTAGLMASVSTAAFDPIFWVHHTNIDRLWTVWECLTAPPRSWGRIPPREWLDAKPWDFNDALGKVQTNSRSFYLDRRNLQVRYDSDQPDCHPLSTTSLSAAVEASNKFSSPLSIPGEIRSFVFKAEAGTSNVKGRIGPDSAYTVEIPLSTLPQFLGGTVKNSILSASRAAPRRVVLEIEDMKVEGVTSAGFDVYVNLPEGSIPTRDSTSYVGTLSLFGVPRSTGHAHPEHLPSIQRFDISRIVAAEAFDPKRVTVQIVPFDLLTPRAGQPRLRRAVGVTHGAFRVLVLEGSTAPAI